MAQEAKKGRRRTRPHEYIKKKCYINWNPSFGTFSICYKPVSPNYFIGSYRDAEIHHHSKIDDKNHPKNCCRKKKLEKVKKKIKIRVNEQSLFGAVIGLRQASRLIYIRVRQPNKC